MSTYENTGGLFEEQKTYKIETQYCAERSKFDEADALSTTEVREFFTNTVHIIIQE
jgi:hypothetical protein